MPKVTRFEDLKTWQKARELNRRIYEASKVGEFGRDFALRDQMRRASISAMYNIAEGFERDGDNEFIRFLSSAKGSCVEIRVELYAALDQKYVTQDEFEVLHQLCEEVSRMISSLMQAKRSTT